MIYIKKRVVKVLIGCVLLSAVSALLVGHTNEISSISSIKIATETLDNVIYADTIVFEEQNKDIVVAMNTLVGEEVEPRSARVMTLSLDVPSDEIDAPDEAELMEVTDNLTYEVIQEVEETYSLEREKAGKELLAEMQRKKEEEAKAIEEAKRKKEEKAKALLAAQARLSYNPYDESKLTVEQYNNILKGTGLEGEGQSYYDMEKKYHVNGLFAISVAFQESGYGYHRANTNNCYGMRSSKGWMSFNSLRDNIMYFGELMNKERYYDKSIDEIAKIYCPPTHADWARHVKSMMKKVYDLR